MGAMINGRWAAVWPEDPLSDPPLMLGDNPAPGPDHDCTSPFHRDPDTDECRICRDRELAESVDRHPAGRARG
jgi:hypothetical protein